MRGPQKKPMHYQAWRLWDGTVTSVFPIRKPSPRVMKRRNIRFREDGVWTYDMRAGVELRDPQNEGRSRFQDIVANSLNARRAVRDLAVPMLKQVLDEVAALRSQLTRIEQQLLASQQGEP